MTKTKGPSNATLLANANEVNKSLTQKVFDLSKENETLKAELEKERTGDIKLPMAASPGQYNVIVEWCLKHKAWYESAKPAPDKIAEPQDNESQSHVE